MLVVPAILLVLSLLQPIYSEYTPNTGLPDDVDLEEVFSFTPIDYNWQYSRSGKLHLSVDSMIEKNWGETGGRLSSPKSVVPIKGDGNCFFRSIAYLVTGDQENYQAIRSAVVNYEKIFMPDFVGADHLAEMEKDGTWAEQSEVLATAQLLETPIFVYAHDGKRLRWLQYSPNPTTSLEWNDDIPRIYLNNAQKDHFEVVSSV